MTTDTAVDTSTAQVAEATPAQEPSVTSPEVNQQDAQTPEVVDGKPPELSEADKAKAAFQKRIDRQTAANRDQQRQLQEEKRLREAAEKRIAEYEAKTNPLDDKPNPDNFDDYEKYTDALTDWKIAQRDKASAEKTKEPNVDEIVSQKLKMKEVETSFRQKEEDFRKATPDYDRATEVVNGLLKHVDPNNDSTKAFSTTLLNAPNPPQLIHYLGTHPDVAIKLMTMSPFEIQDTLGEIIDNLSGATLPETEQQAPKASLPAPPTAVRGSTKGVKNPDQMTGRELLDKYAKGKI